MADSTDRCLPLVGVTLCGYCSRPLTLQSAGDWACDVCRPEMARVVVGPGLDACVRQFARFQRQAACR